MLKIEFMNESLSNKTNSAKTRKTKKSMKLKVYFYLMMFVFLVGITTSSRAETYEVTLTSVNGVTMRPFGQYDPRSVNSGDAFRFTVAMDDGSPLGSNFIVKAGGEVLTACAENSYTIDLVTKNSEVTVSRQNSVESTEESIFAIYGHDKMIYIDGDEVADVVIYDMSGRVVSKTTTDGSQCAVVLDNAGIYIVKISNGTHTQTEKVIIR